MSDIRLEGARAGISTVRCYSASSRTEIGRRSGWRQHSLLTARFSVKLGANACVRDRHGDRTKERSTLLPHVDQVGSLGIVDAPDLDVDADVVVEGVIAMDRIGVPVGRHGCIH